MSYDYDPEARNAAGWLENSSYRLQNLLAHGKEEGRGRGTSVGVGRTGDRGAQDANSGEAGCGARTLLSWDNGRVAITTPAEGGWLGG